jgi:hypothetical protein
MAPNDGDESFTVLDLDMVESAASLQNVKVEW